MGGTCSVMRDEPELQLIMLPGTDSSEEQCKHRKKHKKKDKESHSLASSMSVSQRLPPTAQHHHHPIIYPMPYYGYTPQGYPLYYPYPQPPPDQASPGEDGSPDAKAHPFLQQYLPAGYVMQHEEFGSPKFYESIKWMVVKAIDQHLKNPPQGAVDEDLKKTIPTTHGHGKRRHGRRSKRDQQKAKLLMEGKSEKTEGTLSEDFGTKKTETLKTKKFPTQELADKIKLLLFGGDKLKQQSPIKTTNIVVNSTETPVQKCNHRADPKSPAVILVNVDTEEGDKTPTKITLRIREKTISLKGKKTKSINFPSQIRASKAKHLFEKTSKFSNAESDNFVKELGLKQPVTPPIEIKTPRKSSKNIQKISQPQKHSLKMEQSSPGKKAKSNKHLKMEQPSPGKKAKSNKHSKMEHSSPGKKAKSNKHSKKAEKPEESPTKLHANLDVQNPNFTLDKDSKKNLKTMKTNKESRKTTAEIVKKSQKKVGRFHHIKSPKSLLYGGWVVKSKPHSKSKPTSSTIKQTMAKDSISVDKSDIGSHHSSSFSGASSSSSSSASTTKSKPDKHSGRQNKAKPHSPWDKFSRSITKIFNRKKS